MLRDALQQAGVPVTQRPIAEAGHGFGEPDIDREVEDFIGRRLRGDGDGDNAMP